MGWKKKAAAVAVVLITLGNSSNDDDGGADSSATRTTVDPVANRPSPEAWVDGPGAMFISPSYKGTFDLSSALESQPHWWVPSGLCLSPRVDPQECLREDNIGSDNPNARPADWGPAWLYRSCRDIDRKFGFVSNMKETLPSPRADVDAAINDAILHAVAGDQACMSGIVETSSPEAQHDALCVAWDHYTAADRHLAMAVKAYTEWTGGDTEHMDDGSDSPCPPFEAPEGTGGFTPYGPQGPGDPETWVGP